MAVTCSSIIPRTTNQTFSRYYSLMDFYKNSKCINIIKIKTRVVFFFTSEPFACFAGNELGFNSREICVPIQIYASICSSNIQNPTIEKKSLVWTYLNVSCLIAIHLSCANHWCKLCTLFNTFLVLIFLCYNVYI